MLSPKQIEEMAAATARLVTVRREGEAPREGEAAAEQGFYVMLRRVYRHLIAEHERNERAGGGLPPEDAEHLRALRTLLVEIERRIS